MDLTMLVAKILAIYLLAVGVGMLNGNINIKKNCIFDMLDNTPNYYYNENIIFN